MVRGERGDRNDRDIGEREGKKRDVESKRGTDDADRNGSKRGSWRTGLRGRGWKLKGGGRGGRLRESCGPVTFVIEFRRLAFSVLSLLPSLVSYALAAPRPPCPSSSVILLRSPDRPASPPFPV